MKILYLCLFAIFQLCCFGKSSGNSQEIINGGNGGTAAGKVHFENVVNPSFNVACRTCHELQFLGGNGLINIYNYNNMFQYLSSGGTSNNINGMILKMLDIAPWGHDGFNQCVFGIESSPCKEVVEWWNKEFPGAGGPGTNQATGVIVSISEILGLVEGWAADPDVPNLGTAVTFYVDGNINTGIIAGTVNANLPKIGVPVSGNHGYSLVLPNEFRNAAPHTLYAYVEDINTGQKHLLGGSPFTFTAFAPNPQGEDFFDLNVAVIAGATQGLAENACINCHAGYHLYLGAYSLLGSPTPANGGSPTNNFLIRKINGTLSHGGGNFCDAGNGQLCTNIQAWWRCEFQGNCI